MSSTDERDYMGDEREATTDDVEGHYLGDAPNSDAPTSDRTDEGDDVEAHMLSDAPNADRPNAD